MLHNKKRLQVPQGTESFYLEEAYRHKKILSYLESLFTNWGYLPAQTPAFDFYDTYKNLINSKVDKNIYRLIDRDGDLLMLRSDITLFLAKQMGLALTQEDLPVRVWYSDSILRHQDSEDISRNEFYQLGSELIGKSGIEGDLEILLLLIDLIDSLKLDSVIHIGSSELLNIITKPFSKSDKDLIFKVVSDRNHDDINKILKIYFPQDESSILTNILGFIGDYDDFLNLYKKLIASNIKNIIPPLDHLKSILNNLLELDKIQNIRIDFSETGSQKYYTGIVFQAYMEGIDSAFASGGRYDSLLESFGFKCPSVGFSLLLRKIEPLIKDIENFKYPDILMSKGKSFAEKYRFASKMRKEGKITIL